MQSLRIPNRLVRPAWWVLLGALVLVLGSWLSIITAAFGDSMPPRAIPSPPPVHEVATVVTVYPDSVAVEPNQLCAEVTPNFNFVIADTSLGYVLASIRC